MVRKSLVQEYAGSMDPLGDVEARKAWLERVRDDACEIHGTATCPPRCRGAGFSERTSNWAGMGELAATLSDPDGKKLYVILNPQTGGAPSVLAPAPDEDGLLTWHKLGRQQDWPEPRADAVIVYNGHSHFNGQPVWLPATRLR